MKQYTQEKDFCTEKNETWSVLEQIAREGARKMLQQALELEVEEYIQAHTQDTQSSGKRTVVRNGYHPGRSLISGIGPLPIRQPRVDDRKEPERFNSNILPKYLRRMPSVDKLIPFLYLKGISSNDFPQASVLFWEKVQKDSPLPILSVSRNAGKQNINTGPNEIYPINTMSISGQTASISRSGWMRSAPVSW